MQLIGIVAKHHGLKGEQAQEVLWRECIALRVRLAAFALGWLFPRRCEYLRGVVRGFGRCHSHAAAQGDIVFYKKQLADRGTGPINFLFAFSGRRMIAVADRYFAEAGRAAEGAATHPPEGLKPGPDPAPGT